MNRFDEVHINAQKSKERKQSAGWWQRSYLWHERYTISDISRPTENEALDSIHTRNSD